jgi:transposase
MPTRTISKDLKSRIPILFHVQGYRVRDICEVLGVRKTMVYSVLRNHRLFGTTTNPHARPSRRHRILDVADINLIRALLFHHHTMYLDEIQLELEQRRNVRVSIPTLVRTLRRIQFSSKAVSIKALERNDLLRAVYMNRIGLEVPNMDMVMFADESAKDDRTDGRKTGWSMIGSRCVQRRCFIRGRRFSILPILTLDGIITYDIIEGSVTADRFLQFLNEMVVC